VSFLRVLPPYRWRVSCLLFNTHRKNNLNTLRICLVADTGMCWMCVYTNTQFALPCVYEISFFIFIFIFIKLYFNLLAHFLLNRYEEGLTVVGTTPLCNYNSFLWVNFLHHGLTAERCYIYVLVGCCLSETAHKHMDTALHFYLPFGKKLDFLVNLVKWNVTLILSLFPFKCWIPTITIQLLISTSFPNPISHLFYKLSASSLKHHFTINVSLTTSNSSYIILEF